MRQRKIQPEAAVQQDGLRQLIERALPAAQEHAHLMRQVKAALEQGDDGQAVALLRGYWGLEAERVKS